MRVRVAPTPVNLYGPERVPDQSMEFELSDEEQAFQAAVRKFGDKVLRTNERRIDSEGRIPGEVLDEMARLGLLAMPVPTEYGGIGGSAVLTELAAEEIGRGDFSMATAVFFLLEAGWGWMPAPARDRGGEAGDPAAGLRGEDVPWHRHHGTDGRQRPRPDADDLLPERGRILGPRREGVPLGGRGGRNRWAAAT